MRHAYDGDGVRHEFGVLTIELGRSIVLEWTIWYDADGRESHTVRAPGRGRSPSPRLAAEKLRRLRLTNDMIRFENGGELRLAVFVSGARLSAEQVDAVEGWVKEHPEARGRLELSAGEVRGLSPDGLARLLGERLLGVRP